MRRRRPCGHREDRHCRAARREREPGCAIGRRQSTAGAPGDDPRGDEHDEEDQSREPARPRTREKQARRQQRKGGRERHSRAAASLLECQPDERQRRRPRSRRTSWGCRRWTAAAGTRGRRRGSKGCSASSDSTPAKSRRPSVAASDRRPGHAADEPAIRAGGPSGCAASSPAKSRNSHSRLTEAIGYSGSFGNALSIARPSSLPSRNDAVLQHACREAAAASRREERVGHGEPHDASRHSRRSAATAASAQAGAAARPRDA